MSALHQALSKLDFVVEKLEGSVKQIETSMVGKQRDMFGEPPSNQNAIDQAEVAQRLDKAIHKVESLLVEEAV